MKSVLVLAATLAAIVTIAYLAPSQGLSESGAKLPTRKLIERLDIPNSDEELRLTLVEFPAGHAIPAHRHPVAGLCYVIEGSAETQYAGEDAQVVSKGGSFQDKANTTHVVFRNASSSEPLKFICAVKIKKDQEYLLPQ